MHLIVGGMRQGPRVIALAFMAVGAAGCSGETTRFNDSPFPARQPEVYAAPVGRYEQQPLPPPQGSYPQGGYPQGNYGNQNGYGGNYSPSVNPSVGPSPDNGNYSNQNGSYGSYGSPQNGNYYQSQSALPATSGGGRGMVSYAPNASPVYASGAGTEYTGSVNTPPRPVAPAPGPRSLAPPPAIIAPAAGASVHVVAQGDTLYNISRRYGRSVNEIAKANNMEQTTPLRIGARVTIPGTQTVQAAIVPPKATPKLAQPKPLGSSPKVTVAQATPAGIAAVPSPSAVTPKAPTTAKQQVAETSSGASAGTNSGSTANAVTPSLDGPTLSGASKPVGDNAPSFRWPVRGRVIEGYGPKANGQQNDGINLAVPEGTPVKAAEDGVVAYAGNELKGYGNLLLVRHSNGYVTAYAHSKELLVKRGEEVKRGQVIAKSGQTGNVDAPQLHFEVRKGQAPMNPLPMLKADGGV